MAGLLVGRGVPDTGWMSSAEGVALLEAGLAPLDAEPALVARPTANAPTASKKNNLLTMTPSPSD
jgi:hypothetical protein